MENSVRRWNGTSALRIQGTSGVGNVTIGFATGDHGDGESFDGQG